MVFTRWVFGELVVVGVFILVRAQDPLADLSDEFEDPSSLSDWQRAFEEDGWQHDLIETETIADGALTLEPYASGWYQGFRGNLFFKNVTGDFVVTANVTATGRSTQVPSAVYSLGGLMARVPVSTSGNYMTGQETWTFIATGTGTKTSGPGTGTTEYEVKTTVNSNSVLSLADGSPTGGPHPNTLLQLARFGNNIVVLVKPEGSDWRVHRCYGTSAAGAPVPNSELPNESVLQVGMNAYSDYDGFTTGKTEMEANSDPPNLSANPDLRINFHWIRFCQPGLPASIENANFWAQSCSNNGNVWMENCCTPEATTNLLPLLGDRGFACAVPSDAGTPPSPSSSPSSSPTPNTASTLKLASEACVITFLALLFQ